MQQQLQITEEDYHNFIQAINERFKSKADLHWYMRNKLVSTKSPIFNCFSV
jgi:hypothetical protein